MINYVAPDLDFDRSTDGLRGLAEGAGLEVVHASDLTWVWEISVDSLWRGISGGVASVGQTFLAQDDQVREAAEREFRRAADTVADGDVLSLASSAAYVVAVARA